MAPATDYDQNVSWRLSLPTTRKGPSTPSLTACARYFLRRISWLLMIVRPIRRSVVARAAGALVVSIPCNLGIGGAVQTGLKFAREHQYDMVIRLDGDGQHDPAEIPDAFCGGQEREKRMPSLVRDLSAKKAR